MSELNKLNLTKAKEGLLKKDFSVKELLNDHIQAIEQHSELNSYIYKTFEQAQSFAEISQTKINQGNPGSLEGIPLAVKDLFCTKDIRTTACSGILKNFIPNYESTVTANIFNQGGIMLGKTNMDEFAMGSANTTSYFGPVINPWSNNQKNLVPGGSSGGSAAAVAARLAMFSLGSDTGGSVRQPASFCGIVGMKPTYGSCSRYGMISFASSLDQAGVFARSVDDVALSLDAMIGFDPKDSTSVNRQYENLFESIKNTSNIKGMKIGIPKEYQISGLSNEIVKLWNDGKKILQEAGAELVDISLPHTDYALAIYYIIAPAEASSNLARYDGVRFGHRSINAKNIEELYSNSRAEGFGAEVKRRIMIGTYVLSLDQYDTVYLQAQKVRSLIIQDFAQAFSKVDAILVPSTTGEAFAINQTMSPIEMYLNDIFTIPASLAGLPCLSLPITLSQNKLPLGLQLIGNNFAESTILKIAKQMELEVNFNFKPSGV